MSAPADAPPASHQKKKKKKRRRKRRSECLDDSPPGVDSLAETKKKRKREGGEEEETSMKTKKKKRKEVQEEEEEERVNMVTTDNMGMEVVEEKKKKKKKKEQEIVTMVTPDDNNMDMKKKKKKKKERADNVDMEEEEKKRTEVQKEENITMVTTDNMREKKKQKKKKKEERVTIVTPDDNNVDMEEETKKKKREEVQKEESITMAMTDNVHMEEKKKKNKRKEERVAMVTTDNSVDMEVGQTVVDEPPVFYSPFKGGEDDISLKRKKKRKEVQEEERVAMVTPVGNVEKEESIAMVTTGNKNIRKKKTMKKEEDCVIIETSPSEEKKSKRKEAQEEGSIAMVTAINNVGKKKRKEGETDCVIATCPAEGKKGRGDRNRLMEQSVTTVTTNSELLVPMRKNKDCVAIGTTETEVSDVAMAATNKTTQTSIRHEENMKEETYDDHVEAQLQELKEFIPDLSKKSPVIVQKMLQYDLSRFKEFKMKGVALRWGRFSEEENEQIRSNIYDFMALTGIESIEELMFPQRFKEKEAEIKKLRKNHQYLLKIAEGIPRSCLQILIRARKMMDNRNTGRFSEDEVHSLVKLQTLHGNDWKTIAEKMNRSNVAVLKRFATTGGVKGAWSPDEMSHLKEAVQQYLQVQLRKSPGSGLTRQQLCLRLPWSQISQAVGSRTWYQCRLKWFSYLNERLEGQRSTRLLRIQKRINIINTLSDMKVNEQSDVDWMQVAKAVGVVSPVSIQKSFCRMKKRRVPNWERFNYGEIIGFLMERELPRLYSMLDQLKEPYQEGSESGQTDTQETYQLSEIFPEPEAPCSEQNK